MTDSSSTDAEQAHHVDTLSTVQSLLPGIAVVVALGGLIYTIVCTIMFWTPQPDFGGRATGLQSLHTLFVVGNLAAAIGCIVTAWSAMSWDPAQPERMRSIWARLATGVAGVVLAIIFQHAVLMNHAAEQNESMNKPGFIPFDALQK